MIIAILSGVMITAMNGSGDSRAVDAGVSRLDGLFSLARSAAITRQTRMRVLISLDDSNLSLANQDKPQRFLRYATIVYEDENGDWQVYTEGEYLPDGTYFSPALSTTGGSPQVSLNVWPLEIDESTLDITQPSDDAFTSVGPFSLTGNTEAVTIAGADLWVAFEFSPNGTFTTPGARVVVIPGILDPSANIRIATEGGLDPTDIAKGFVVFRSGKSAFFKSGAQIKEGN